MKAKGTELFTCLDLSEEGEKGRKIKSFRPVPLSSRNKVFVRKEYVEETDEKLVWWELNVLGRREGPHNTANLWREQTATKPSPKSTSCQRGQAHGAHHTGPT